MDLTGSYLADAASGKLPAPNMAASFFMIQISSSDINFSAHTHESRTVLF